MDERQGEIRIEIGDREAPPARESGLGGRETWLVLVALLLVFNSVKLAHLGPANSDENLYFYMGKLVSEGHLPYRDFRFAHPPLRLLPPAILFATVGTKLTALKLIPVLCANLTALLVFLSLRRRLPAFSALLAVALFLFSWAGLFLTSYAMGTNLTVTLLVAGFFLLSRRRDAGAGAAFGAALATGLYAAPALAGAALYLLATDRARLRRIGAGFGVVAGSVYLLCFVVGGSDFLREAFAYQLRKGPGIGLDKGAALLGVAGKEALLLLGLAAYPFFRKPDTNPHYLAALAFTASFFLAPIFQPYYFGLAAPFFAIATAVALSGALGKLRLSPAAAAMAAALLLGAVGARNHVLAAAAHEQESLPQAAQMAEMAKRLPPDGAVFGMQSVAPLVAMLADREVFERHLDTDSHAYLTGVASLREIVEKLAQGPPVLVITTQRVLSETSSIFYGPMVVEDFRRVMAERFQVVYTWVSAHDPAIRILFHFPPPPPQPGGPGEAR